MQELIRKNLSESAELLSRFMADQKNLEAIGRAALLIAESMKAGHKAISCGNGGSMCDAMHFAEELSGRFRDDRKALPAISISDPSHLTCVGNDYGFDKVFSRFIEAVGAKGDVLLAISTSGNSANVLHAATAAKAKGMKVIGLTGKDGGKLAALCDVEVRVPHNGHADRIQEVHIKVIHSLIHCVEQAVK